MVITMRSPTDTIVTNQTPRSPATQMSTTLVLVTRFNVVTRLGRFYLRAIT
ncbi:MAG: hypothetical protein HXY43_16555 [Fischerella sp.]|uniref:hypothetical protein n=1 Tax=Fischerella sp. TaxID=1191 RepID=UPI0017D52EAE|nr:hypothetical protein [Fischerella sp.]NWF60817.1 hypothetical protein [Fischerella sp.]